MVAHRLHKLHIELPNKLHNSRRTTEMRFATRACV